MKLRYYISVLVIVLAIGSLGFTTLFFYDYNSKVVMVEEVQEKNEDVISAEKDYELDCYHNWTEWILPRSAVSLVNGNGLFAQNHTVPRPGYFLDLIKPPIH